MASGGCSYPSPCNIPRAISSAVLYSPATLDDKVRVGVEEDYEAAMEELKFGKPDIEHRHAYVSGESDTDLAIDVFLSNNGDFVLETGASARRGTDEWKRVAKEYIGEERGKYGGNIAPRYKEVAGKTFSATGIGINHVSWNDILSGAGLTREAVMKNSRDFFTKFPSDTYGTNMYSFLGTF